MKYGKPLVRILLLTAIIVSVSISGLGYTRVRTADRYAGELFALQTAQSRNEQNLKILLARRLSSQARSINIYDNSNQTLAVLLAVQSMKMLPTIEASQVLQYNLSASEMSRMEHDEAVLSATFSPDGTFAATGGLDRIVRVWETSTGKEVLRMRHDNIVQAVTFSPNGKYIASASADHTIRIWDATNGKEVFRMTHNGTKLSIAYSPNGEYIASSALDRAVRIWDTRTGKEVAYILHSDSVTSIAFSPDNLHIATGSADNVARVWDIATGKEIARATHAGPVTAIAFSPDGKIAISGSVDRTAQTWDTTTGEGVLLTLDIALGKTVSTIRSSTPVKAVAFSPDGKYVAIGSEESKSAWMSDEIGTALIVLKISPHGWDDYEISLPLRSDVIAIAFSPDGQYLLSSSEDRTVRVWDIRSGREVSRMTHDGAVTSIAFSPDGKKAMSSSMDHTTRVWKTLTWQAFIRNDNTSPIPSISFSPDGHFIASGRDDGSILIQNATTGEEVGIMKLGGKRPVADQSANPKILWLGVDGNENKVNSIAFSPNGKLIISGSADNTVRIWDIAQGREIARMLSGYKAESMAGTTYYISGVNSVAFSPNGKCAASGGADGSVYIWDINAKQAIIKMTPELTEGEDLNSRAEIYSVAFSPDGRYVVSGGRDGVLRVWEIATKTQIVQMTYSDKVTRSTGGGNIFSPHGVNSVAFNSDGKYVISGGRDNIVRMWSVASGQEILQMEHDYFIYSIMTGRYEAHGWGPSTSGNINSVAFSRDGKYILSASDDNTVRIWDAATGQEFSRIVHYVNVFRDRVLSVAISPDGKYVASGDSRGKVNLWLWRPNDLIADACARLPRNLTRDEWTTYIGDYLPYQAVCPNLPLLDL